MVVESEKMSLSVVEGGSKIKLTSGWKEFKFFLVVQFSRATALVKLPNFAVNEIACWRQNNKSD